MFVSRCFRGRCPSIQLLFTALLLICSTALSLEHAVIPSCSTDASGSTSCNVGINPVATFGPILDGGYQWLSEETATKTVAGVVVTETTAMFTASETNFLSATPITYTEYRGAVVTTTQVQYISFITATPSVNNVAVAAVIAGVVVAPALVGSIQTIADAAAGKSVQQIANEIIAAFGLKKALLSSGDVQTLAKYVIAGVAVAGIAGKLTVGPIWTGPTISVNDATTITGSSTSRSTITSNTGSAAAVDFTTEITVTAVVKTPYENWIELASLYQAPTVAVPDEASLPTASCSASNTGIDPAAVNKLASTFCTGSSIDFSKDASKDIPGEVSGIHVQFDYKHVGGTCEFSCEDNYRKMIKSCEFDSHAFYGAANLADACALYALTVLDSSSPTTTTTAAPIVTPSCADHTVYTVFPRYDALDAIGKFCKGGINLPSAAQSVSNAYGYFGVVINLTINWSASGQAGAPPFTTSAVSQADCIFYFTLAVDLCDTDTVDNKFGAKPMTWSSPIGNIDFAIYGTGVN